MNSCTDIRSGAVVGFPQERCEALRVKMHNLFPGSGLWRLEEGRSMASQRDMAGAMAVMRSNAASKMKQVNALNAFELALAAMYVQEYDEMHDTFLRCVELNDWSHALYYYLAGCAELEKYRDALHGRPSSSSSPLSVADKNEEKGQAKQSIDKKAAEIAKKKAEELLRKAPKVAGKKKFMGDTMPFEQFVLRKLARWEERADALGISLAEAAGVCPSIEMIYLFNGCRKMRDVDLQGALARLDWDRLTAPSDAARQGIRDEPDEQAARDICAAALLRNLGRYAEAREKVQGVLNMDRYALSFSLFAFCFPVDRPTRSPDLTTSSDTHKD